MIGFVFATHTEAKILMERCAAEPLQQQPFSVYRLVHQHNADWGRLLISGVGKVRAALGLAHLAHVWKTHQVVNAGLCGALGDDMQLGQVYRISSCCQADALRMGQPEPTIHLPERRFTDLPQASLCTVDKAVFDPQKRKQLAQVAQLVDMEGAAIALAAELMQIEVQLIKVVSDWADQTGQQQLEKNLRWCRQTLAQTILAGMEPS